MVQVKLFFIFTRDAQTNIQTNIRFCISARTENILQNKDTIYLHAV